MPGAPTGSQTGGTAAFTGLASSPDANLFTGAAEASIPLEVPPGRLGFAPALALSYSSQSGASAYGEGWSLPLPRVHRSTRRGLPSYSAADEFVLEMPGATVELERVPGTRSAWRARIESSFARIGFDEDANTWKVIDKLGVTFTFGSTAAARKGRGPTRDETFAWLLVKVEDPAGNRIDWTWREDASAAGLPERVEYGANARAGLAHFASVTFEWLPPGRTAPTRVSYRHGFAESLALRLAAVETQTHGVAARRYDFTHDEDAATGTLTLAGVTLTAWGEARGEDVRPPSTVFVYAPALSRGWPVLGAGVDGEAPFEIEGVGLLRVGEREVTATTLDLDGDSIPDRLDTAQRPPRVSLGTGRSFGPAVAWNWPTTASAPRAVRKSDGSDNLVSNVFDLDGDGMADLVTSDPVACGVAVGDWCVWLGTGSGFAPAPTRWPAPVSRLRVTEDGGARIVVDLVDMDADGLLDLVDARPFVDATARWWNVHRNDGHGFEAVPRRVPAPFGELSRSKGGRLVRALVDMNGDALPDLVSADPGNVDDVLWGSYAAWQVHAFDGRAFSDAPAAWPVEGGVDNGVGLPNFAALHDANGGMIADLFDLTGDGLPDLVRRNHGLEVLFNGVSPICRSASRCTSQDDGTAISPGYCCFNLVVFPNTGSSFGKAVPWSAPAHGLRSDTAQCPSDGLLGCSGQVFDFDFFDLDGDGLVEFIERFTAANKPLSWLVHPHPGSAAGAHARPNLLVAMRNGVGGETMLRYTTASRAPGTRLPFAHWMVAERELRDSSFDDTSLLTSFAYRGGLFDPAEREMRGFALVRQVDPVGTSVVREYHQDRRRAGRALRTTTLPPPPCPPADPPRDDDPCSPWGAPLGVVEYDWPDEGPVLLASETDTPWHHGRPVAALAKTTTYAYDAYGNATSRTVATPLAATTTTETRYAHHVADLGGGMPGSYLVAKPTWSAVREEGRPSPLVEKTYELDFSGSAPGRLAATSTCMAWDGGQCARWSRRSFEHDAAGNVVSTRAGDGSRSVTGYDAEMHFAVRSTDPNGLVTETVTDPRHGQVTSTTTPGGVLLRSRYDGLGRLLRTWGPGQSRQEPLRRIEYFPGTLAPGLPRAVAVEAAGSDAATFFDGLGRVRATRRRSDVDGRVVVTGLRRYRGDGLAEAEALPFVSASTVLDELEENFSDAPAWLSFSYDEAGRLVSSAAPDGSLARSDRSAPGILRTDDANATSGRTAGTVTLEFFDGLGRRLQRDTCSAPPLPASPYDCPAAALARREEWTWDGLGRLVEQRVRGLGQAAGDSVLRVAYDGLGNRAETEQSDTGLWLQRSDERGRVVEVTRPGGSRITLSYDAGGRLLKRRARDVRSSYRYHRDGAAVGKVRRVSSRSRYGRTTEDFEYDGLGRLAARTRRVLVSKGPSAEGVAYYGYDDFDRRVSVTHPQWPVPGDEAITIGYDDDGRVATVATTNGPLAMAAYDAHGRLARLEHANGVADLAAWQERSNAAGTTGHLACLRTAPVGAADATPGCIAEAGDIDAIAFAAWDPAGNLLSLDDRLHAPGSALDESRTWTYDALGRLQSATSAGSLREDFAFDPLGNLVRNGGATLVYADRNHPGRVTERRPASGAALPFQHDEAGRRTGNGLRTYGWDSFDRLEEEYEGSEVVRRHGYDDAGQRTWTQDLRTGRTEIELGDGLRVAGDKLDRTVALAGRPVVVESVPLRSGRLAAPGLDRRHLHGDHQGSVRTVTDAAGRVLERRRYSPWGALARVVADDGSARSVLAAPFAFTGHRQDGGLGEEGLLFFGARYYDPATGSFLSPDPSLQFASPYAYSDGNPVLGRDPDGRFFGLGAVELVMLVAGTATFVDSIVRTGDLGHSLTAGVTAGFSAYFSAQLSTVAVRPLAQGASPWLQMTAAVASDGFQAASAVRAIDDGRYAGGIASAGMLAASLIGIESANDPGSGATTAENMERHGIEYRGVIDGRHVYDVNGICATRPGCITNSLVALRENLKGLITGGMGCVGGCDHIPAAIHDRLSGGEPVLLRCNSFGSIKCLGAIQNKGLRNELPKVTSDGKPLLSVEMSGSPILRPPRLQNVTYQVNLFDPVPWIGTAWSTPLRSDVKLGENWWVPTPLLVHHTRMYEKPFGEALGEILP